MARRDRPGISRTENLLSLSECEPLARRLVIKLAAIYQLLQNYREDHYLVFCEVNTKKVQVCSNHLQLLGSELMEFPVEVSVLIWI